MSPVDLVRLERSAVSRLSSLRPGVLALIDEHRAALAELDRLQAVVTRRKAELAEERQLRQDRYDCDTARLLELTAVVTRRGELLRQAEMWCNRAVHHLGCPADVNLWHVCNCGRDAFVAAITAELAENEDGG